MTNIKVKELRNLPRRDWQERKRYRSLYIINSWYKHDSWYAMIYIIGIISEHEMEIAAACDDICRVIPPQKYEWEYILRTDMMYPSGVLHMWSTCEFEVWLSLSSTTVTLIRK